MSLAVGELRALLAEIVIGWPNTPLGFCMRGVYWGHKTGKRTLRVWKGARLHDCRWIVIGDNVELGDNVEFAVDGVGGYKVFIGSNIQFARGVYLRSANHRFDDPDRLIMEQGHTSNKVSYRDGEYAVVVESNSWIGANVVILSGALIGEGSVIGAGSIVNGVIPPYSVAAGSPARVISSRKPAAPVPV